MPCWATRSISGGNSFFATRPVGKFLKKIPGKADIMRSLPRAFWFWQFVGTK